MITGIPQYQSPVEQSMRCLCGVRYLIYMGGGNADAESTGRTRAEIIKARFVDARLVHFIECECGEELTFVEEATSIVM